MTIEETDTIVVGSGIAGLFTALHAARHGSVTLVTKSALEESNTRYAQGGIAVALDDSDVAAHEADTLFAGAGLCDEDAVRVLCGEGPARVNELIDIGVAFDKTGDDFARGSEGAHGRARVLHAGGDATGMHIESALAAAIRASGVVVVEHANLLDIVIDNGRASGVRLDVGGEAVEVRSRATVLATGGAGQVYAHTTNPAVATGDGLAAAFRAGAVIRDAEMYQFHPTALAVGNTPFLVSEAVRGDGAVLRDENGNAFMREVHPLADLAPRDIVARAIHQKMGEQDGRPVVLDATSLGTAFLAERFPRIHAHCSSLGLDWGTTPVPVSPAAHYWMGGVATDLDGRTSVPGLFAVGEVASTGVHGANRLASNSLLEGVVFGARVGAAVAVDSAAPVFDSSPLPMVMAAGAPCAPAELRQMMWDRAGLVRDDDSLAIAAKQLAAWNASSNDASMSNMLTVATLIVNGAIARTESRGAHHRLDHPQTDDAARHIAWSSC